MPLQALQPPPVPPAPTPPKPAARRPALPTAHGEPAIWMTGAALVIAVLMIVGIISLVVYEGSQTFWPRRIDQVTLKSGQKFLGIETQHDEEHQRRQYRVGNRDIGQAPFRWVEDKDVASVSQPAHAVMLERTDWGVWFGEPASLVRRDSGGVVEKVAEGPEETIAAIRRMLPQATKRTEKLEELNGTEIGGINNKIEAARLGVKGAELEAARTANARQRMLAWWGVGLVGVVAAGCVFGVRRAMRLKPATLGGRAMASALRGGLVCVACVLALLMALENPLAGPRMSSEQLVQVRQQADEQIVKLEEQYKTVGAEITKLQAEDEQLRVYVNEVTTGHFAPVRQSQPDEPMKLSQIVRLVQANELSKGGKLGVYFSRWGEYLTAKPRASGTEGGVFPVIFGTVLLTLLLAVAVVPLGVIAALYLREYARQGPLVSLIRIAVNNLAGVPSVVYGMFGLGFFAYTVGAYIDAGPTHPSAAMPWWWVLGAAAVIAAVAIGIATLAKGVHTPKTRSRLRIAVGFSWLAAVGLVAWAVWTSPYFGGFYAEKLPTSTFGTKGLLWAALTLALLTLPVVIVATEEAIAAVPRSVREGSYGCGASKWQTVRRIVLPQALPGIMTGAILAMARGAGEVAPLMLVGAAKSASELPVDGEFPFVHGQRSFMHLGFHIFDLGFQSPDSEAARPLVWTTTLLLILIVLALNLTAVIIRARLRARVINASV